MAMSWGATRYRNLLAPHELSRMLALWAGRRPFCPPTQQTPIGNPRSRVTLLERDLLELQH